MTEATTPDIPALRALLEKAARAGQSQSLPYWEQMDALQVLDAMPAILDELDRLKAALPALLDAAEERDRLREALETIGQWSETYPADVVRGVLRNA